MSRPEEYTAYINGETEEISPALQEQVWEEGENEEANQNAEVEEQNGEEGKNGEAV